MEFFHTRPRTPPEGGEMDEPDERILGTGFGDEGAAQTGAALTGGSAPAEGESVGRF